MIKVWRCSCSTGWLVGMSSSCTRVVAMAFFCDCCCVNHFTIIVYTFLAKRETNPKDLTWFQGMFSGNEWYSISRKCVSGISSIPISGNVPMDWMVLQFEGMFPVNELYVWGNVPRELILFLFQGMFPGKWIVCFRECSPGYEWYSSVREWFQSSEEWRQGSYMGARNRDGEAIEMSVGVLRPVTLPKFQLNHRQKKKKNLSTCFRRPLLIKTFF